MKETKVKLNEVLIFIYNRNRNFGKETENINCFYYLFDS